MKKNLTPLVLAAISLFSINNTTQAQWVATNTPNPVPQSLYTGIHFFDGNNGVVVGSSQTGFTGETFKTQNGAQNWGSTSLSNGFFNDVDFANNNVGFSVSILGEIIKTTNGGDTWNFQTSGTNNSLFGVSFISKDTGWVVGDMGTLLSTTNGGATWNTISANINANTTLFRVKFLNSQLGFAVGGDGKIYKTTNGGQTWTNNTITTNSIRNLFFIDTSNGYAVSTKGGVFKTTNGGTTWSNISISNTLIDTTNTNLFGVWFTAQDTGYVVGWDNSLDVGYILKTNNAGATWTVQLAQPSDAIWDIQFLDNDTGYAVGIGIYKTINAGDSSITTNVSTITTITLKGTKLITIYPNPTSEKITIQLKKNNATNIPLNFTIYNNVGQLVLQENNINNNLNLSVAQLPQGFYTYTVATEDGSIKEQGKLIKR